jgi:hypothetical protein
MTPAERAYRLALLAYPAAYRRERGLEILTALAALWRLRFVLSSPPSA